MRKATTYTVPALLLLLVGCGGDSTGDSISPRGAAGSNRAAAATPEAAAKDPSAAAQGPADDAAVQKVSLSEAEEARARLAAADRKVVRNAELKLEVAAPAEAQRRIASVAESQGGFVVTSESKQQPDPRSGKSYEVVTMQVRVPAPRFDAVMGEIRAVAGGGGVAEEKITGQDVTEEYIDLESRVRTQRALEAQLLELLRRAGGLSDAIVVRRELAGVRAEIEKVEGRRRFLENQSSLSTINVTIQPPAPLIASTPEGFFTGVSRAFGSGVDFASATLLVLIQLAVSLLPVALLVVLPVALTVRHLRRRNRTRQPLDETPLPLNLS